MSRTISSSARPATSPAHSYRRWFGAVLPSLPAQRRNNKDSWLCLCIFYTEQYKSNKIKDNNKRPTVLPWRDCVKRPLFKWHALLWQWAVIGVWLIRNYDIQLDVSWLQQERMTAKLHYVGRFGPDWSNYWIDRHEILYIHSWSPGDES